MKERNYLASNNKVNGLIIEDAWCSRELPPPPAWLMLAFDLDGTENESDTIWKTVTAHIVMGSWRGGGNQFALGCFYRSRWMSVILASSHLGGSCVIYFMLLQCMCSWARLWVITHIIFFFFFFAGKKHSMLSFFFFFSLPSPAFQMSHFRWKGFYGSACMPIRNPQLQPRHNHTALAPVCVPLSPVFARRCWRQRRGNGAGCQIYIPPFLSARMGTSTSSPYCFSLLSPRNVTAAPQWAIKTIDPILYDTAALLCVSASSIISDPVILIAHKHKVRRGGEGRINNTVPFLHRHLMP